MGAYAIQEVTVVAYYQNGVLKVAEILLQPGHRLHVQVVGRLVEQKVVWITKQRLSQHHTHLLLVVEFTHQHVVLILLDAQTAQQGSRITLSVPAIQLSKLLLQFRNLQAILIREIGLGIEGITLVHNIPKHRMPHQHGVHHRVGIPFKVVLTQNREPFARTQRNRTGCRVKFSRNRF